VGCSGADNTGPATTPDRLQLTAAQVKSLDSIGQVIVQANPGNANLKALADSTLAVLTAGIEAKRVDIATNLTTAPLYLVGIHRAAAGSTGSYSTWTLVAIDDPSRLANLAEVSGFAQSTSATPPASALETMHVHFTTSAAGGSGGAGARQASLSIDTDVPAMRLTYTP
jgi:hypothetical protein